VVGFEFPLHKSGFEMDESKAEAVKSQEDSPVANSDSCISPGACSIRSRKYLFPTLK